MTRDPDRPAVVPSEVDPDVECVRVDDESLMASPPGPSGDDGPGLCPEGYVPRPRRRGDLRFEGKRVVTGKPPTPNPAQPDEPAHPDQEDTP